jgi:hypothetical protein
MKPSSPTHPKPQEEPLMKSAAAFYVLVALNSEQQHAQRQPARAAKVKPSRPSLLGRVRAFVPRRSVDTAPATSAA